MGSEKSNTWVVTGSSRGLGLGLVKALLDAGEVVVATARNPDNAPLLEALSNEHAAQLTVVKLDTAEVGSIKAAASEVERMFPDGVDILINNAGITGPLDRARNETAETVMDVLKTNVVGVLLTTQAFLPLLQKGRKKQIINISSGLGSIQTMKEAMSGERQGILNKLSLAYKMSKAALNMQTVALAMDLRDEGLTVISLTPGWVATDMGSGAAKQLGVDSPALDVQTSVQGQLAVIRALTPEQSGSFFNYEGEMLPF